MDIDGCVLVRWWLGGWVVWWMSGSAGLLGWGGKRRGVGVVESGGGGDVEEVR